MILESIVNWLLAPVDVLLALLPTCASVGFDLSGVAVPGTGIAGLFVDLPMLALFAALVVAVESWGMIYAVAVRVWDLLPLT